MAAAVVATPAAEPAELAPVVVAVPEAGAAAPDVLPGAPAVLSSVVPGGGVAAPLSADDSVGTEPASVGVVSNPSVKGTWFAATESSAPPTHGSPFSEM